MYNWAKPCDTTLQASFWKQKINKQTIKIVGKFTVITKLKHLQLYDFSFLKYYKN